LIRGGNIEIWGKGGGNKGGGKCEEKTKGAKRKKNIKEKQGEGKWDVCYSRVGVPREG